jgi:hypothetical protein
MFNAKVPPGSSAGMGSRDLPAMMSRSLQSFPQPPCCGLEQVVAACAYVHGDTRWRSGGVTVCLLGARQWPAGAHTSVPICEKNGAEDMFWCIHICDHGPGVFGWSSGRNMGLHPCVMLQVEFGYPGILFGLKKEEKFVT